MWKRTLIRRLSIGDNSGITRKCNTLFVAVCSILLPGMVSLTAWVLAELMIWCHFPVFPRQCRENYNTQYVISKYIFNHRESVLIKQPGPLCEARHSDVSFWRKQTQRCCDNIVIAWKKKKSRARQSRIVFLWNVTVCIPAVLNLGVGGKLFF